MSARTHAPFRQVKASAGSGKTYALTTRFLELLAGAMPEDLAGQGRMACAGAQPGHRPYAWPEILAVTFTNKAAAEMKERVLAALKGRALGLPGSTGLDPARAEALLLDILRHTQHLGIRTIDSLLNLLVRLFALDCGLRPDFETVFDPRPALEDLLGRFLARCEEGGPEEALYDQALRTLLQHEEKEGFWLQEALRERLVDLAVLLLGIPGPLVTDQGRMADLLAAPYAQMQESVRMLRLRLDAEELEHPKNFAALLDRCGNAQLFSGLPDSRLLDKDCLDECLLKRSQGQASPQAEAAFQDFGRACAEYSQAHAVLDAAYGLAPCVAIARGVLDGLAELQQSQGFVFGTDMARTVCGLLKQGSGVPEAFCRLGDRLHHLLVDEFQDTSRAQWEAARPLALECLAKGGSLFTVGDVKQAIYAWRGGDAKLFDEVAADPELLAVSSGLARENLPHNWRSAPEIIAFNNRVFGRLEEPETCQALAQALLRDAPQDIADAFVQRLRAAFQGSAQTPPPLTSSGSPREPGLAQVRLLPPGRAADSVELGLDALADVLQNQILPRRPLGDVAVLVRSRAHADLVCERLVREGLPIITEDSLALARHPIVRQIVALLRVIDHPPDDVAFLTFVSGQELFLAESGLTAPDIHDWACSTARSGLLARFRADFPEIHARLLAPFLTQAGFLRPYDLVQGALAMFQVLGRHPGAELYVRRLLEVVHQAETQGLGTLARFLEFWDEQGLEEKVPLPEAADAVRILTIHKAKGLQFPVVIVPFHNWSGGRSVEYRPVTLYGHRVLTRLTKALGRPYYQNLADSLLEQANLLYVAWTRAEEELYAFVPSIGGRQRVGPVPVILKHLLDIPAEEAGLTQGQAPALSRPHAATGLTAAGPAEILPRTEAPEFQAWLPRLRVYRHAVEDAGFDERTRGKLAHKAVELLRPTGPKHTDATDQDDACRATALALAEFPELRVLDAQERDALAAEVRDMLLWLLSQAELRPHLERSLGERTVLTAQNGFLRPDVLRLGPDGPVVLEFKTGQAAPEHQRQVRSYLDEARLLAQAQGVLAAPRGFLVYLDRRVVQPVENSGNTGARP